MATSAFSPVAMEMPIRLSQMKVYLAASSLQTLGAPITSLVNTCQDTRSTRSANSPTQIVLRTTSRTSLTLFMLIPPVTRMRQRAASIFA